MLLLTVLYVKTTSQASNDLVMASPDDIIQAWSPSAVAARKYREMVNLAGKGSVCPSVLSSGI